MRYEFEVVVARSPTLFKAQLNGLGAAGWELIHASSHFVCYRPVYPMSGGGGGGGGPAGGGYVSPPPREENGYTKWTATLKRQLTETVVE